MIVVSEHDTLDSEHDTCVFGALAQLDSEHGDLMQTWFRFLQLT
jgi:hypothetical protein